MSVITEHTAHLAAAAHALTAIRNASAHALITEREVAGKIAWSMTLHAAQQALSAVQDCCHSFALGAAAANPHGADEGVHIDAHFATLRHSMQALASLGLWAKSELAAQKVLWLLPAMHSGCQRLEGQVLPAQWDCPELPGRPEQLEIVDYVRYELDRDYPRRKLHQQIFNVEVCAGEVCAMLVLRFPELPGDVAESLTLQCVEEFRHAQLLLGALANEGGGIGETPVSLGIWKSCRAAQNAADCIGLEQVIGEGFSLGADLYYAELYRAIGRADISMLHECIYIDEVNHVKNGLASFHTLLGAQAVQRLRTLEESSKVSVVGGRFFNAAARQYVGFSTTEIERQRDRSQPVELPDLQGMME